MIDWYDYWKIINERKKQREYKMNSVRNELRENRRELAKLALFCFLTVLIVIVITEIGR